MISVHTNKQEYSEDAFLRQGSPLPILPFSEIIKISLKKILGPVSQRVLNLAKCLAKSGA